MKQKNDPKIINKTRMMTGKKTLLTIITIQNKITSLNSTTSKINTINHTEIKIEKDQTKDQIKNISNE